MKALRYELPNEPTESVAAGTVTPEELLPQPRELTEYEESIRAVALADPEFELPSTRRPSPPPQKPKSRP